jgi:hypothetical protein
MTLIIEISNPFQARPGIHRGPAATRLWWGWFAVSWLHVPYKQFVTTAYDWEGETK